MTTWSSSSKTLRRVGRVWLDPISVESAVSFDGTARFYLRGGHTVETPIPDGQSLESLLASLFKEKP